jgi:hypothetical protein
MTSFTDRPSAEHSYTDRHWQSGDGLTLHFRDYPGRRVVCPSSACRA